MSLLIKGGEVVDGTGMTPKKSDVLIVGNRIAAMGDLPSYKADRVIQAAGSFLLPGFTDISTVSDTRLSLFDEPSQADFLKDGVTTIVGGTKGFSLAPAMYAEELPPSNIGWQTIGECLGVLQSLRLGVNFVTFSGYKTLRNSITPNKRNLGAKEIKVISFLLEQCFTEGSLGVSLDDGGFAEFDATPEEIATILKILKKQGKTAFIPLNAEDKSYMSFIESGVKAVIGNLNESLETGNSFDKLSSAIEKRIPQAEFVFAFSPYPYFQFKSRDIFPKTAGQTGVKAFFDNLKKKRALKFFEKKIKKLNLEKSFVFDTPRKGTKFLMGKSIAEFAENRRIKNDEAIIQIINMVGPDASFLSKMDDDALMEKFVSHPRSVVGSFIWSPMPPSSLIHSELSHPFSEFLRLSDKLGHRIELTVKKLSAPARLFGFKKRGVVKEGYAADLVILKNNRPESTIVNGEVAFEDGLVKNARSGEIIIT
ncbi:MAG: hypothetical protein WC519_01930 [Parcubacteria group bacterium]